MIQRIQTVYLFLVLILCSACFYFSLNMVSTASLGHYFQSNYGFLVVPGLALITIFLYKRRPLQSLFTNIIIFLLAAQGFLFAAGINLEEGFGFDEMVIFVSFSGIVLLWFARRNILKDEALVRSVDRIR